MEESDFDAMELDAVNRMFDSEMGYIYELDGQVFVNPRLRPFADDYTDIQIEAGEFDGDLHHWNDNNIPVVNACPYDEPDGIVINPDSNEYDVVVVGQKVFHINGRVKRII